MQLSKQTKSYIYVIIVTVIILLLSFLLFHNTTTNNNVAVQNPLQQNVVQPPPVVAEPSPQVQSNENLTTQTVEPPEAAQEEATISEPTTPEPIENGNKNLPVVFVAVVALVVAGIGVGGYFLVQHLKNRSGGEEIDDFTTTGEPQHNAVPFWKKLFNQGDNNFDEEPDKTDESGGGNSRVAYEEGRGYYFDASYSQSNPEDDSGEQQGTGEAYDFDYSDYDQDEDQEEPDNPDKDVELELCKSIEYLADKANRHMRYIEMVVLAENPELQVPQYLLEVEDADELPGGVDGLQQEVNRLKNKINGQIDYIEQSQNNQADNIKSADNNGNDNNTFMDYVAAAFDNMQQNDLVYQPKTQNNIIYVASAEFFTVLSKTLPDYKKKNALEALEQQNIVLGDTVYNKKRVLKINNEQFLLLTTKELAHNAGA